MKQSISRRQFLKASGLAAAGACAAGLLSSCGGKSGGSSSGSASGADTSKYTVLYSSQPATLNYLTTATDLEMVVGANCVDTLVEYDNKGVMREGLATKWEWDADTLTWTFTLREENWVDNNGEVVAPVTAQDFVDALQYVLTPDYASSNVGLVTAYIAGANDYYNYHVYLTNAENGTVDEKKFHVANFSSRGPAFTNFKPDLLTSGVNLTCCSNKDGELYTHMSGTSVATPLVAGLCALIVQKYPEITPLEVKGMILNSCKKITGNRNDEGFGYIHID